MARQSLSKVKPAEQLLHWYATEKRDLPWRKTCDPYHILVSEVMLQQTQVDRVVRFYERWLKRFPDWEALAQASIPDIIHAWAGLGYNRRALALREIAQQVVKNGVPQSREAWLQLKGIGPYTSAAIALFAQGERVFPVDSIIRRVGGRLFLGIPFADAKEDERIEKEGGTMYGRLTNFRDIPQAFFDLGTKVCQKQPFCESCPLQKSCRASSDFIAGKVLVPRRSIKKGRERIHRNKKFPDRIYRGRILKAVRESGTPLNIMSIAHLIDPTFEAKLDADWLDAMVGRLEKDGFIKRTKNRLSLV